jgi:magnesium transporter
MQIFQFNRQGQMPVRLERVERLPKDGFIWMDFARDEASEWPAHVEPLAEAEIHDNHVHDSFSSDHPSFFDVTEDYDMMIFQGLIADDLATADPLIVTKSATFFLFDRLLVTVHADENKSFEIVKRKFCESKLRFPSTPFGLTYVLLDTMVDRYLEVTDELEKRLERVQAQLMDPKHPFEDWQVLLSYRKQAHDLEVLCEHNLDAIDTWKREMRVEISEKQRTRLNDLREHIQRVQAHADGVQKDIEVAVQLHFASVSHQTNRVIRTLTVMSAIFFPMTLLTGIYGMNFQNMPELAWRYGYFATLIVLVVLGGGLAFLFKRRGFF